MAPGFTARTVSYTSTDGSTQTQGYQLFLPVGYNPSTAYKCFHFFHGSGDVGTNNTSQLTAAMGQYVSDNAATFPDICVFPQHPSSASMPGSPTSAQIINCWLSLLKTTLDDALTVVNIDQGRIYASGFSLGAYRVYGMWQRSPTRYAALAPIEGEPWNVDVLNDAAGTDAAVRSYLTANLTVPMRVYHQSADPNVSAARDQALAAAMTAAGVPSSTFTYVEKTGSAHDWTWAQSEQDVLGWLRTQSR